MADLSAEHAHPWEEPCTLACPAHFTPEADILAQHVLKVSRNDGCFCTCGEFSVGRGEGATDAHARHQAEALRGAAHPYTRGGYSGGGPASSVSNPAKVPSAARPWSDPDTDPLGDIIDNYGIRGLLRVNGIAEPKTIAVNGELVYQADPDVQGDSSTPGAEHDAPTSQPASGSRDRFFDEVIEKYGDSFKLRKNPDEKVVFPMVVVDDSEKIDRLCQAMIEGSTEHDWADLPDDLREGLRTWNLSLMRWSRSHPEGEHTWGVWAWRYGPEQPRERGCLFCAAIQSETVDLDNGRE